MVGSEAYGQEPEESKNMVGTRVNMGEAKAWNGAGIRNRIGSGHKPGPMQPQQEST